MKYLSIVRDKDIDPFPAILAQIPLPNGMTDEWVQAVDAFLRKAGLLAEDTELCITTEVK